MSGTTATLLIGVAAMVVTILLGLVSWLWKQTQNNRDEINQQALQVVKLMAEHRALSDRYERFEREASSAVRRWNAYLTE